MTITHVPERPMTNRELLDWSGSEDMLYGLERQRRYVLRIEGEKKACPNCGNPMTAWEGRGFADVDSYDLTEQHDNAGTCTKCGRAIKFTLPLMGEWHWRLVPIEVQS